MNPNRKLYRDYFDRALELKEETGSSYRKIARMIADENPDEEINVKSLAHKMRQHKIFTPSAFEKELKENNLFPINNWSHGWLKAKGASICITNPEFKKAESVSYMDFRQDFIEEMKAYAPKLGKIKRKYIPDCHLLVIDIADLHIGKLSSITETGEEYNVQKAIDYAIDGVNGILDKSAGFNIDRILFVIGNDVLHFDTPTRTTTSGTHQDSDGMWYDNFVKARMLYVEIIRKLRELADVHVIHCPSNHDYMSGFMLADSVSCSFREGENVTFQVSMKHRKYYRYGNSLIGLSHGDGAKEADLPQLMANEAKKLWAVTDHHYYYLHHYHSKKQMKWQSGKDYHGCTVEYLRSPSATDSWHHRNGFSHSPKAIESFIHSKQHGQVARISHIF